jgi:hypothetical protein
VASAIHQHLVVVDDTGYRNFENATWRNLQLDGQDDTEPTSFVIELFFPHRRLKRDRWITERPNAPRRIKYEPRITSEQKDQMFDDSKQRFDQAAKVLYVLDDSCGSEAPGGYRGRGA